MKLYIDGVTSTISPKISSHKASWAYLWKNQIKHFISYDVSVIHGDAKPEKDSGVYLDHGMEFKGSLNLFGGATNESAARIARLLDEDITFISLDIPMPDYGALGKSRLSSCSDGWRKTDWDAISARCREIPYLSQTDLSPKFSHLVLGDSHSHSVYTPKSCVSRNDGQTLYGALKLGLSSFFEGYDVKTASLYFGNIDIRHHLMRQTNPKSSIDSMHAEYEKQILSLGLDKVEMISVLPIENESRVLPKTGYYKGTPFAGTWKERTELVRLWNDSLARMCERNKFSLYEHPKHFTNSLGELKFEVMEKPRSVHLSREFYRWNLENDTPNNVTFQPTLEDFV